MAERQKRRGGKKNRKHGRALKKCARYRSARRREVNKERRLLKHLRSHPRDGCAEGALARLELFS